MDLSKDKFAKLLLDARENNHVFPPIKKSKSVLVTIIHFFISLAIMTPVALLAEIPIADIIVLISIFVIGGLIGRLGILNVIERKSRSALPYFLEFVDWEKVENENNR